MYCSNCGMKAVGNFCSACGSALNASTPEAAPEPTLPLDWSEIVDCDVLLSVPEVRDLIASHAARSTSKMSGEKFLEIADKVLSPLTAGVPLSPLAKVGQSMYAKLGVKTGKSRDELLPQPVGQVIVRALCSLAEHGQELQSATAASDGCVLKATLPSDMLSFAGELIITIERTAQGTRAEAYTHIPGQAFDWGKSNRALATLFDELRSARRVA